LSGTNLNNKCKWYNGGCKTKCDSLSDTECGGGNYADDCVEVKDADGESFFQCYDKVCTIHIHIHIYIYIYIYMCECECECECECVCMCVCVCVCIFF
jgi:hypothetical protein